MTWRIDGKGAREQIDARDFTIAEQRKEIRAMKRLLRNALEPCSACARKVAALREASAVVLDEQRSRKDAAAILASMAEDSR